MANSLNREELIQLLSNLGDENDEVVLSAAKEIGGKIREAGVQWDDLLIPESGPEIPESEPEIEEAEDDDVAAEAEEDGDSETDSSSPPPDDQESLKLIEKLLAKSDLSEGMRDELEMYRDDINDGDFSNMDRKYVRALYERLTKS